MVLLQLTLSGIALGCIYALIALGFVLIYKATETVNFAQGELMMLGAFAGLALMLLGLPFWAAALIATARRADPMERQDYVIAVRDAQGAVRLRLRLSYDVEGG